MKLLLTLLFFLIGATFFAGPLFFPVNSGIEKSQLTAISRDEKGRILLGTNKGLFQFNGSVSKPFQNEILSKLPIKQLLYHNKTIFILGKNGEFYTFFKNKLNLVNFSTEKWDHIRMCENQILAFNQTKLLRFKLSSKMVPIRKEIPFALDGKGIVDVISVNGNIYALLFSNELVDCTKEEARPVPFSAKFLLNIQNSLILCPELTKLNGFLKYNEGKFQPTKKLNFKFSSAINKVKNLSKENYFFTTNGLFSYNVTTQKTNEYFLGEVLTDVTKDNLGNFWGIGLRQGLICSPISDFTRLNNGQFKQALFLKHNTQIVLNDRGVFRLNANTNQLKTIASGDFKNNKLEWVEEGVWFRVGKTLFSVFSEKQYDLRAFGEFNDLKIFKNYIYLSKNEGFFRDDISILNTDLNKYISENSFQLSNEKCSNVFANENGVLYVQSETTLFFLNQNTLEPCTWFGKNIESLSGAFSNDKLLVINDKNELFVLNQTKIMSHRFLALDGRVLQVKKIKSFDNQVYIQTENGIVSYDIHKFQLKRLAESSVFFYDFSICRKGLLLFSDEGILLTPKKFVAQFSEFFIGIPYQLKENGQKTTAINEKLKQINFPLEIIELLKHKDHLLRYRLVSNGEISSWSILEKDVFDLKFNYLATGKYTLEIQIVDRFSGDHSKTQKRYFQVAGPWLELSSVLWFTFGMGLTILFLKILKIQRKR